ncbi:thermonuclease family protein [Hoeflea sp. TYP-13]|uniref:thermonuclease family protein n=1 Tax=Hoeflea sp. TYP-13 TaxID=3230023 RepID=UPI0034C63885
MFWLKLNSVLRPAVILVLLIIGAVVLYRFVPDPASTKRMGGTEPLWTDEAPDQTAAVSSAEAPRAIEPARFATPFAQDAARLERIAPRPPLTPQLDEDTGPRPTLLHRPLVIAAGQLAFPQGEIRLKGLIVTDPDETCSSPGGLLWPCGIIARTAFRNFMGGRSLSCAVPSGEWEDPIVVTCLVGKQDPAAWLVTRGWVRTPDDSKYADFERTARDEGIGLFGEDPRGLLPVPDSQVVIAPDGVSPLPDPLPVPLR